MPMPERHTIPLIIKDLHFADRNCVNYPASCASNDSAGCKTFLIFAKPLPIRVALENLRFRG